MRRDTTAEDWRALKEKLKMEDDWYPTKSVYERLLEFLEALPEEEARTEKKPDQKI
ncbi:MAG: hypothetical protein HY555_05775 [Euryarchaeota archaeon]|nr:hypothetical protein [Euryarchaeota archaeon]